MNRTLFAAGLAGLVCCGVLTGCAGGGSTAGTATPSSSPSAVASGASSEGAGGGNPTPSVMPSFTGDASSIPVTGCEKAKSDYVTVLKDTGGDVESSEALGAETAVKAECPKPDAKAWLKKMRNVYTHEFNSPPASGKP